MYIDSKLYTGRPAERRIDKEERCYELLDTLAVPYVRADHELGCEICKNLLLTNRQMTDVYLLLMPGDKPFKTKLLSKQIGSARLSFASPEQMLQFLDITPGSVSVLGLMNDREGKVRLLIDRDLLKQERIGMHPCINSSTLGVGTKDLLEKVLPAMGHEPTFVDLPWNPDET